jgi:hypothetical protein
MWHVRGKTINTYRFWWGIVKEVDHLEDLNIDGSIILKFIVDN